MEELVAAIKRRLAARIRRRIQMETERWIRDALARLVEGVGDAEFVTELIEGFLYQ